MGWVVIKELRLRILGEDVSVTPTGPTSYRLPVGEHVSSVLWTPSGEQTYYGQQWLLDINWPGLGLYISVHAPKPQILCDALTGILSARRERCRLAQVNCCVCGAVIDEPGSAMLYWHADYDGRKVERHFFGHKECVAETNWDGAYNKSLELGRLTADRERLFAEYDFGEATDRLMDRVTAIVGALL